MRPLTNEDKAKLMKIRALLDKYMPYILENPTEINYAADCMYDWTPAAYVVGDVRKYNGIPYKCVQAHDSTDNTGWTPPTVPALWMEYHGTDKTSARNWIAPTGAHDMYKKGEWMIWTDGSLYECLSDTSYSPADYAAAWQKDGEETTTPEPNPEPNPPAETVPDFVQPTGAHDAYKQGDKVKFKGKIYESLINNNTWSPTAYPLGWKEVEA